MTHSNIIIRSRVGAYTLVACQAILTLLVTAGFWLWGAEDIAYATFLGGMVCVIPQLVFASCVFRFSGATQARKIMNRFYTAEALKWLLTFVLFAVIIPGLKPAALPFFIMYIAAMMVFWLAPLIFKSVS